MLLNCFFFMQVNFYVIKLNMLQASEFLYYARQHFSHHHAKHSDFFTQVSTFSVLQELCKSASPKPSGYLRRFAEINS